jgi:hypothetical protein
MLLTLANNLWVTERPLRVLGLQVGARMTVLRRSDGGLLLLSPVALDDQLRRDLDAIGPVRYFAAPGLEMKRKDLHVDEVLSDTPPSAWAGEVDQIFFSGVPFINEVMFFHRSSRTLILTDLAFNIRSAESALTRIAFQMYGAYGKFGPTIADKLLLILRRSENRQLLDRVLDWDFDRVIVAHGDVLETGGRNAVRAVFAFL